MQGYRGAGGVTCTHTCGSFGWRMWRGVYWSVLDRLGTRAANAIEVD